MRVRCETCGMAYETITVALDAASATGHITLNRPDKRNALNARMVEELGLALTALESDNSVRVVVLRGAGDVFCAGADLSSIKALQTASYEDNLTDSRRLMTLFERLYLFPKPSIAVVHGPALAGGAGLATCCDFIVAGEHATFGYTEVKVGFVAAIVMVLLTRQVGERQARRLLLTGETITAAEAGNIGLVNMVVLGKRIDDAVAGLASQLTHNSPQAMVATKRLLAACWSAELSLAFENAAQANAKARTTDDCREGIAAFLEKRHPSWK